MTRKGKPDIERSMVAVWDLLPESGRAQMRAIGGYPPDWDPRIDRTSGRKPMTVQQRFEGLEELGRIMRLPPGFIDKWRDDLVDHNQPDRGE